MIRPNARGGATLAEPSHDLERCSLLAHLIGRLFLWCIGWRTEGEVPPGRKFVVIASPHTSNWDFLIAVGLAWSKRLRMRILVKDSHFRGPTGWFVRAAGGIPVDRSKPGGLVQQLADHIQNAERIALLVPPTGTRSKAPYWKSGFYHIARAADVPVVSCTCDYARNVTAIVETYRLTGDLRADMDHLREVYRPFKGKFPENMTPIRLREEDQDP